MTDQEPATPDTVAPERVPPEAVTPESVAPDQDGNGTGSAASGEAATSPRIRTTAGSAPEVRIKAAGRYTVRFIFLYGGLGLVLVAAVAGLVILLTGSGGIGSGHSNGSWSTWKPVKGTTAKVTSSIASHVAQEYHLNAAGAQLLAVVSGPPQLANGTHKVEISHIAVRKSANNDKGIQVFPSGSTWTYQLCGLGTACSIASGQASDLRGRLVRREALEVALYTFKFVPAINSVVAFMPPPPGQTTTTLLYLQKDNLTQQLSQSLRTTLPLAKPPLPTLPDTKEAATIDRLTLPAIYSYSVQALQDNSALLILDPIQQ